MSQDYDPVIHCVQIFNVRILHILLPCLRIRRSKLVQQHRRPCRVHVLWEIIMINWFCLISQMNLRLRLTVAIAAASLLPHQFRGRSKAQNGTEDEGNGEINGGLVHFETCSGFSSCCCLRIRSQIANDFEANAVRFYTMYRGNLSSVFGTPTQTFTLQLHNSPITLEEGVIGLTRLLIVFFGSESAWETDK